MCGCINSTKDHETMLSKKIDRDAYVMQNQRSSVLRLLLVGAGESGKSTFVKQCKNLYTKGWSKKELLKQKTFVYLNVLETIQALTEIKEELCLEYSNSINVKYAEEINDLPQTTPLNPEICEKIDSIWNDTSIKTAYEKRSRFQIIDSCEYFMNKVQEIGEEKYIPNIEDVLNLRVKSTGITETRFTYSDQKYCLIDVGGQRNERKKWIHCFEDVSSIVFVSSLSAYDQVLVEEGSVNRMNESMLLFSDICNTRWFRENPLILFLNKLDLFQEKIKVSPLNKLFPDYEGGVDVEEGKKFIKNQFLSLNRYQEKNIFPYFISAIDPESIKQIFRQVNDNFLQKKMDGNGLI
ncbi:guanine nucleotide-binding protein g(o) subunit alpha [Anaeramoeba flamelloides]|uniref:Guanine nucleotide-binding protein g(O) subunit alpha n=1 Tax=Anaeramoeba flamelloides TaxID=1746091 RepID=A0ABQ8XHG9_9EUKA|nr:guanine nucleotide-binding protein g(o) subunit alpha [Anaeramoeba flamelloides]